MRSLLRALAALAILATAGSQAPEPTRLDAAARALCVAQGGQIATAGLSGDEMCALPLADAGRFCASGSQCLGDCLLDETSLRGKRPDVGARVPGRCQALNYPYGCRQTVENGRLQGSLCVD